MSFKVIQGGINRVKLQLVVYCNFRRNTTVPEIQAVLMLKTTFLPSPLVFELEFEGNAVGMWRQNLAPENYNHGAAIWRRNHDRRLYHMWAQATSVRQTDRFTNYDELTKTALCIASRGKSEDKV